MGKSQITQAAVATLVTHVTWKKVKTTRGSKEKMDKFTPRKKARYATGQSNESPTRAGSSSIQEPNLVQGNDADLYCYMDDASPLRTSRIPKSQVYIIKHPGVGNVCLTLQNSYLEEWLPYKSRYLSVLLDMEALPNVMACFVQKWNGRFFEDFTLWLVGLVLHLGHARAPCLAGEGSWEDASSHVDEEWEDMEESQQPAHLNPPDDRNYLTVVDTGSMHFCNLTMAGLFPATTKAPRTAFTFQVLDDFTRDNAECGTPAMNYYSKLQRVTSSMFPHLVLFARTFVMDGNFKAKHMLPKNAAKEVWLMDGYGFMVTSAPYKEYLTRTINQIEKSDCNNHWAVNQANAQRNKLESTRIGGCACYSKNLAHQLEENRYLSLPSRLQIQPSIGLWHVHGHQTECFARYAPNFIPGAGWVDGEIMETLWSSLNIISPSAQGMATAHHQELLDFQMNDTSALKWKFKVAKQSLATIQDKFNELDSKVPDGLFQLWVEQELVAQSCWQNILKDAVGIYRTSNTLQAMDIYEVQLEKAPTMKAIEIDLIHNNHSFKQLMIEQAQIVLAMDTQQMDTRATEADWLSILCWQDWLQSQIDALVHGAAQFNQEMTGKLTPGKGPEYFHDIGLGSLVEVGIHLRQGQANDGLHELCLERRELQNDNLGMGADIQCRGNGSAACCHLLPVLKGRPDYPNARGHCNNTLAWFWTMDLPQDSAMNDRDVGILSSQHTIALWYLPGAITNDLQASLQTHMLATLDPLHHTMSKSMTSGSWWKNAEYFNHASWSLGCLEFSLARHQQGHMVWLYYLRGLYDTGRQAMQSLDTWLSQHNQDMHDALQHWPSVFTNVSIISNQTTPFHQDPHSWSNWYDMLVMVGNYEDCVLDIPTLSLQFLTTPAL
ncbi:hypothetical protein F5J12DRAFT_787810 [Pisolithus orientalis]|uniref:uncharacterized protein n=1 Tax=Pisolithus orientalis TaxID=936130 RepID=UPI0022254ACE|nr:uncharacterized protein F5J12DRAFT_787810 [Pisolithus orientalis]KAI5983608.1 hypothetical protein F5J12DRAFT_787810 [Pisolithus orientalis]